MKYALGSYPVAELPTDERIKRFRLDNDPRNQVVKNSPQIILRLFDVTGAGED